MTDSDWAAPTSPLPPHAEQTVQAISRLNQAHESRATTLQRLVDRLTAFVARPAFIGLIAIVVAGWIGGNLLMQRLTGRSLDHPPFIWLHGGGELAALIITTLVLISQRRKDELSELREELTLELAILTEQKSAKAIALLEEMRRDHPHLADRVDAEAEEMAEAVDPEAVIDAVRVAREVAEPTDDAAPS